MATDEPSGASAPFQVSAEPAPDGENVRLTLRLTFEMEPADALDLALKLIGAVARAKGLDAGERP